MIESGLIDLVHKRFKQDGDAGKLDPAVCKGSTESVRLGFRVTGSAFMALGFGVFGAVVVGLLEKLLRLLHAQILSGN